MKKHKGLIILIVILIMIYVFFFVYAKYNKVLEVSSMQEHSLFYTKKINIYEEKYYIKVVYPYTIYNNVNQYIDENINKLISEFKEVIKEKNNIGQERYFLEISFDIIETNKYLNFTFDIQKNTGDLHPQKNIFTVNIDKMNKSIITIEDLTKMYNNYLEKVSNFCYNELKKLEDIKEQGAYTLLELGTKGKESNYKNFIIMNNSIEIIFEHAQIAPYYLGEFSVIISREYLNEENT